MTFYPTNTRSHSVYADPFALHDYPAPEQWDAPDTQSLNFVFDLERSACALFGIVTHGVHMSAFEESADGKLRIWVPTRAKTKQTYVHPQSRSSLRDWADAYA